MSRRHGRRPASKFVGDFIGLLIAVIVEALQRAAGSARKKRQ